MAPDEERVNEGHVAIRFGDGMYYRAWLDDVEVTNICNEAIPGNPGVVILFNRQDREWDTVIGNVRVESK